MCVCTLAFARLRSVVFGCGIAAALTCCLATPAAAGDILVTGGYLDMTPYNGPLVIEGDRGFTFTGRTGNGLFPVVNECNAGDAPCGPGDRVSLLGAWSSLDLPGTATLDGVAYPKVGDIASMAAEFSASLTLPPFGDGAEVMVPFVFRGRFGYPNGDESLTGSGVVTVSLAPHLSLPGRWRVTRVLYEFGGRLPTPWLSAGIGAVGVTGRASFLNDTFTVAGNGGDIWGTADGFHFAYAPLAGAGVVSARVSGPGKVYPVPSYRSATPHHFAKAGVMIRESTGPSAPSVVLDVKPDGGLEFMARVAGGEPTTFLAGASTAGSDVWLELARSADNRITASYSLDGTVWVTLGTVSVTFSSDDLLAGLAVTSHESAVLHGALFEDVSVASPAGSGNLLTHGDFEAYEPPALGPPGWISDDQLRQLPAKSETHQPRSGAKNGACWTTGYLDCGIYQEVAAPVTGTYTLRVYATADRSGGLVGANVNGLTAASQEVAVRPFGDYALYTLSFAASVGDVIRVWMYSPAWPGYVVIDDASLVTSRETRRVSKGSWTISAAGGRFGTFALEGSGFTVAATHDYVDAEPFTLCRSGCRAPVTVGLRTEFSNETPTSLMLFAPGQAVVDGYAYEPFVEFGGTVTLKGGAVVVPAPSGPNWPQLVTASAPFTLAGVLKGFDVVGVREATLAFELPLSGQGTATLEMLAQPNASGTVMLTFFRLRYDFEPDDGSRRAE